MTVLFVDAVGSTALAESLGEEQMYSLMREGVSRMAEAVHRYEGHVATFTGDGLMAVFGAPIAHEDSARRAVAAGLGMQRALEEQAAEVRARHGVELHFRVGLNTGPVVVGTVSDELTMELTAIGDTVNLAARVQTLAEPGAVCLTEATHRSVADYFECEALGFREVKGKVAPVALYRAVRERPVRTRLEVAAERGLAPFVGRQDELAVLEGRFQQARQGYGQVVVVSGEAGLGKSRLLLEFRRHLAGTGATWLEGHCISYGRSIPYLPLVEVIKRAFDVEEADQAPRIIECVIEGSSNWDDAARATVPYLRYLLNVDPGDATVATTEPRQRRSEILAALGALVIETSRPGPLVLVVEDLHWVDEASEQAVVALTDVVPAAPVLLVLTSRARYAGVPERTYVTRFGLEPLGESESAGLVEGALGARPSAELERLVAAKAEGNPFYVEEVVRSLVETGVVVRDNGTFRLDGPVEDLRIPNTVQEVVLSRIDRLEPPAKGAIQLASVIGREFTLRLLQRISDLEARLEGVLGDLKALELIYEKAHFPELAFMFKHALTHDVAYSTLLTERRRTLHRLVAAAIEELYSDRLADQYETLAHHWYEAQTWPKALEYLVKAGDKAAEAFANREALVFYDRALEVAARLGEARTEAAVAERKSLVGLTVIDLPAALADTERMGQAGRRLEDRRIEGRALARRGRVELIGHEFEAAEASFRGALAVGGAHDDVRFLATFGLYFLQAVLFGPVAAEPFQRALEEMNPTIIDGVPTVAQWIYMEMLMDRMAGRYDLALARARRWRELTSGGADSQGLAQVLWAEGLALTEKGDYERALATFLRVDVMTERMGDPLRRGRVLNSIGWLYNEVGGHEEALSWNVRAVEFAQAYPAADAEMESNARLNLGDTLMALGRLDEADEHFDWVKRVVRRHTPKERWILWRYAQHFLHSYGELCLRRGQPRPALDSADECLSRAEATGAPRYVVKARRLRGQALMALDDLEGAEREVVLALARAEQLGNPPQLWKTHGAIGDLRSAQRRTQAARRAYAQAVSVIDDVAGRLTDERLRETLHRSTEAQALRRAAGGHH